MIHEAKRFNVLCCGRRFGKTVFGVDRIIRRPLEGLPAAWFAPNYKYLDEAWRDIKRVLHPVAANVREDKRRIELITGGVIECWSLDDPDAGRSRKYADAVVDEAAKVRKLEQAWNEAIRPTLADYRGGAWFLSTPKGLDYFHNLYERGQDPEEQEWMSWRMPTATNPFIHPDEIEAARRGMPERAFHQEFLAEFLEDGGIVFRRVKDAATATPQEKAVTDHEYVIGVDWGKLYDFTVITVIDSTTRELVTMDRFNQIDYAFQTARLQAVWERFGRPPVVPEANSMGEPVIEQLQRLGMTVLPFQTTNASKAEAIEGLALAFERAELKILPDPVLTGELLSYQAERLPSGLLRYGAPEGLHDDCVMSLALAWYGARRPMRVEYGPDIWE